MKTVARILASVFKKWYERMQRRAEDPPWHVMNEPGQLHACDDCLKEEGITSQLVYKKGLWRCKRCRARYFFFPLPPIQPPPMPTLTAIVESYTEPHTDPVSPQPMRLSVAYRRNTLNLGKWIQDRPTWKDTGQEVQTGQLPRVRPDDRRTG